MHPPAIVPGAGISYLPLRELSTAEPERVRAFADAHPEVSREGSLDGPGQAHVRHVSPALRTGTL